LVTRSGFPSLTHPRQPDSDPGDIIFVVQQKEHPVFKRKGSDLFYQKTLTLSEALCGFKFAIPHLDGRQLLVSSNDGDVVKPGSFKAVYDEGMPVWGRSLEKGRLFIHFDVQFPEPGDLGCVFALGLTTPLLLTVDAPPATGRSPLSPPSSRRGRRWTWTWTPARRCPSPTSTWSRRWRESASGTRRRRRRTTREAACSARSNDKNREPSFSLVTVATRGQPIAHLSTGWLQLASCTG